MGWQLLGLGGLFLQVDPAGFRPSHSYVLSFLFCELGTALLALLSFGPQEWPEVWEGGSEVWSDSGVTAQPGVWEAEGAPMCLPESHDPA